MNILMISSLDIWSMGEKSGAQSLYATIKGYIDNNHNVLYVTDKSGKKINIKNINFLHFNYKIFNLNINVELWKNQFLRSLLNKIRWFFFQFYVFVYGIILINKMAVDVIYAYEIYGIPSAFLLKIIFNKVLITRFQGTILKPKLKNPLNFLFYIEHTVAFLLLRFCDLVIMANDGTEGNLVLKYFQVPDEKVRFWFNGVNVDPSKIKKAYKIVYRKKKIILNNNKILVTLSRLASWKRVDRIIITMPEIIKKMKNVLLIIMGDGEEKNKLEKLVKDLNISNNVYFTGALPHQNALKVLKSADIFVSLYDLSNMGNPLLEAMKLGKCIVTLNNGDTGKIIINNKTGILLEYKNFKNKLANIIIDLLMNNTERKRLEKNAYIFAKKEFWNWEQRMKQEINEVEKVMDNN